MSRTTRQNQENPASEEDTARQPTTHNVEEASGAPEVATQTKGISSPKRKLTKLPSFGFAADLLGLRDDEGDTEPAVPAQETIIAPLTSEDEGPIFSFADTLTAAEKEAEQRAVEARITTWITFGLADETFALPVEPVREVLRIHNITRVPHAPDPIRGVTNLRGRVIPVIDLRRRIGLPETEIGRLARIVVVASRGRLIGLLVDLVHQVMHLDLNLVQPPPDDVMTVQSDYISGVYHQGDHLLLLLDVDRALTIRETPRELISGAA